jgi:lysophospholipase L1-like esterase
VLGHKASGENSSAAGYLPGREMNRALATRLGVALLAALLVWAVAVPSATPSPRAAIAKGCKKKHRKHRKHRKQKRCRRTTAAPPEKGAYVALGDSLSAGVGASSWATSYVAQLMAHYRSALGVSVLYRRGLPGESSSSMRGWQLQTALGDINGPTDTRVVTIDIGGNDLRLGCRFGSDPCTATFEGNFSQTLSDLQAALDRDPGQETVIAGDYYNWYTGSLSLQKGPFDQELLGYSKRLSCADTGREVGLNDAIAQVASAHGALLADPYPAFEAAGQRYIYSDGIHPNDLGYAAITNAFLAARSPC